MNPITYQNSSRGQNQNLVGHCIALPKQNYINNPRLIPPISGSSTSKNIFDCYLLFLIQNNTATLSDQQEAVSEGQNPLPIYTAVNMKKNAGGFLVAGKDFTFFNRVV